MLRVIECSACTGFGKHYSGVQTRLCASCDGRGFDYVFVADAPPVVKVTNGSGEPQGVAEDHGQDAG